VDRSLAERVVGQVGADCRTVVLVEGESDRAAIEALARRRGRALRSEGVRIVPMGGATNVGHVLELVGPAGLDLRLAGLCDAGEREHVRRALQRAGFDCRSRSDLQELGFFVCKADLEDELVRALGHKHRYARLLVDALDLDRVPPPLDRLLDRL
jgi:hypothetical protein